MNRQTGIIGKIKDNFSSFEDIWLFTQIFFLITALPAMVRFLSLLKLMNVFTPRNVKGYQNLKMEKSRDKIVKFTDYILSRNFLIYKTTCLKRSLVLYHFLRKMGINVHICFGVRYRYNEKLPGREAKKGLEGHAWLLYKGGIILERNVDITETYTMTYCFPDKIRAI